MEGDQNSKFFHEVIAQRWRSSCVKEMRLSNGAVLDSPERVHEEAVKYFEDFLSQEDLITLPDLELYFPHGLSASEVMNLQLGPSEEEVRLAFASIAADNSPGPDGFGSSFYLASLL